MPRMLFAKTGTAVWISHLDLMRALMRGFRRAGLLLKHSQGYSPHPELSIALPLSVGVASACEIAEFDFEDGQRVDLAALPALLNEKLPEGLQVLSCYDGGQALKHLKWLTAELTLCYDDGVPPDAADAIRSLLERPELIVEKHSKKGALDVDLIPMLKGFTLCRKDGRTLLLEATVSAQNPTLNPLLLASAIERYAPAANPNFVRCRRLRLWNDENQPFV